MIHELEMSVIHLPREYVITINFENSSSKNLDSHFYYFFFLSSSSFFFFLANFNTFTHRQSTCQFTAKAETLCLLTSYEMECNR